MNNEIDGAAMVFVPAGEFLMGDDEDDYHKPQRRVYLDDYWIYKYPVTVEQYTQFCRENRLKMPPRPRWHWRADHPIVNVTWHDATDYAAWAGVSLPTEAQWEKAARGTDGRAYPWGNDWDPERCHFEYGSTSQIAIRGVGASPYGAWDMVGNVNEWCSDWYAGDYYRNAPVRNPLGPPTAESWSERASRHQNPYSRVLRGGSFADWSPDYLRCACRFAMQPGERDVNVGFRCAFRPGPLNP